MDRKKWFLFLIALGLMIVVLSPSTPGMYSTLTTGVTLAGFGLYKLKR